MWDKGEDVDRCSSCGPFVFARMGGHRSRCRYFLVCKNCEEGEVLWSTDDEPGQAASARQTNVGLSLFPVTLGGYLVTIISQHWHRFAAASSYWVLSGSSIIDTFFGYLAMPVCRYDD
ncbi:hypothetical protein R1flu_012258 [Riccia fluitans]|uniref:Uncharacterized protein n=1 Tax=Riccia fluitans TaxID=41844 RepID=A0ABD1ZAF8_9MARC